MYSFFFAGQQYQPPFPPDDVEPRSLVRPMQIVVAALIMAVLTFTGVAVAMGLGKPPKPGIPIVAYLACGFAAIVLLVRMIVVPTVVRQRTQSLTRLRSADELRPVDLYSAYMNKMIVATALPEGAAFFNLVAYIIERQYWSLGIVGVLLVVMILQFPTANQVEDWATDQLRELRNDSTS